MIKRILKLIFPIPFLKMVWLEYNIIKKFTWDRLWFHDIDYLTPILYLPPFTCLNFDEVNFKFISNSSFIRFWESWKDCEFFDVISGEIIIEPVYGWARKGRKIIYRSIGLFNTNHMRRPNPFLFLFKKPKYQFNYVISLRDSGEENYFHFYNDLIAKLFFIKSKSEILQLDKIPVLISPKLFEKKYFTYFKNDLEKDFNIYFVAHTDYVLAKNVVFCKPLTHSRDWINYFSKRVVLSSIPLNFPRVFLTRSKNRFRHIENFDELLPVLHSFEYQIIDADNLKIEDQIILFRNMKFLVGIHGAGLTNVVFSDNNIKYFIEIFPPGAKVGYLPFHYFALAEIKSIPYLPVEGEKSDYLFNGGFVLNPSILREALRTIHG